MEDKILEFISKIYEEKLNAMLAAQELMKREQQSPEINELAAALAKSQAEMEVAGKDKVNPFFKSKYADWQTVVEASRPALARHGISVTLDFERINKELFLVCKVLHSSGQWKDSVYPFNPPNPNDIQKVAAYNTYVKRMIYSNAIGISVGEIDDDGESLVADLRKEAPKPTYVPVEETISSDELRILEDALVGVEYLSEEIKNGFKIKSLAQLPKSKFTASFNRINKVKIEKASLS